MSPQVSSIALSVDQRNPLFNALNLPQIEDPEPGVQGPLPALLAALRWVRESGKAPWLQLAPCDTPFIPQNLVGRLSLHAGARDSAACVPRFRGQLHPACGLWNLSLLEAIETAVADGKRGFKEVLDLPPLAVLDWPEPHAGAPDPFFNVNTPADLRAAERAVT
jgi:molybdopterin-guanine dinucleotide biosynthesis protein A